MAEIVATSGPVTTDTNPKKDKQRAFSWVKGLLYRAPIVEPEVWKTYNPGTFKVDNGIGITINAAGRPENIVDPADKREKVSTPVHENYTRLLTNHVSAIIKNINDDPIGFLAILNSPEHQYEKKLLDRICDPEVDPNEKNPNPSTEGKRYKLNENKLAEFLATPAGLEATTMLLEQQATYEMFGTGLTMALNPKGYRELDMRENQAGLGVDESFIANFVDTVVMPYINLRVPDVAGRKNPLMGASGISIRGRNLGANLLPTRAMVISYITGSSVAAGLGAFVLSCGNPAAALVAAGAMPALVALRELFKGGLTYDTRFTGCALKSVNAAPNAAQEKEYIRRMYNISVDDFQVNPANNRVELVPGRTHQTTRTMEDIKAHALGNIFTRLMFYESIGVPGNLLDTLPEQFVFRIDGNLPEKTGVKMQQEFVENLGLNTPAWTGLTPEQRLAKIREVREGMISKRLEDVLRQERIINKHSGDIERLNEQISVRESGRKTKEQEEAAKKAEELKAKKAALPDLSEYRKIEEKKQEQNTLTAKLLREQGIVIPAGGDFVTAAKAEIGQQEKDIQTRQKKLNKIREKIIQETQAKYDTYENNYFTRLNTIIAAGGRPNFSGLSDQMSAAMRQQAREEIEAKYAEQKSSLEQAIEADKDKITALQTLRNEYQSLNDEIDALNKETIKVVPHDLEAMLAYQYVLLRNPAVLGNPNALKKEQLSDLSVSEIMKLVRNPAAPYGGIIPAAVFNDDEKLRDFILKAKVNLKAGELEKTLPSYDPATENILNLALTAPSATLNMSKILDLADVEIDRLLSQYPYNQAPPANSQIREILKKQVLNKAQLRHQSLVKEQAADLDEQIAQLEKTAQVDFKKELLYLNGVKTIVERQGHIFAAADDIYDRHTEILNPVRVPSVAPSGATPTTVYTEHERSSHAPIGYTEFIKIFFDYQKEGDKRDEEFAKALQVLPPKDLAILLNREMSLGLAGAQSGNLTRVLQALDNRITGVGGAPVINRLEIQQGLAGIINELVKRANALS